MTGLSKAIFHRGAAELWVLGERVRTARTRDLATLWSAALMALLAGAILSGSALRIIDTRLGDVWDRGVFSTGPTRIYSFIQGRPLEVCTTYLEDRTAAGQRLRADPERWSSLFGMVRSHYAASRSVLSQPCRGEWRWQPGSFDHLYAGIGRDFPYAWVFVRAGLSDVAVLCGILGLSILGLAIVPYLAWRASGSIAASLISTAASGWIAFLIGLRHLGDVEALMLAGISFLATALVLGVHSSAGRSLRPGSLLWNAALIGSLALVSLSYLFIAPAASSLFVYLAPGLAVASALLARDWRALARGAVALAVVASVMASYLGFTSATLAPLTTVNFGAGGTFAPLALTTGFWTERPNSLGVPLGDYGVFLGAEIDPILLKFKKEIMDYQTYGYYGGYVAKLALSHPLEAAQHIIARFFWKLAFLNKLMFEWINVKDWGIVLSPLVIVALICFVAAVVRLHIARAIVLAFPLFNFFALDILTHVVHVHTRYYASGLVGLVILTPVVAILGSRAGVFLVSGYRNLARRRHLELARWLQIQAHPRHSECRHCRPRVHSAHPADLAGSPASARCFRHNVLPLARRLSDQA